MAVSRHRAGPVCPQGGRLGDGAEHARQAGLRRLDDGDRAPEAAAGADCSFRSRQPVRQRAVPGSVEATRLRLQHEPQRKLLGHSVYYRRERLPNLTRAGIGLLPLR